MRRLSFTLAFLGLLAALPGHAAPVAPAFQRITSPDAVSLRSIAGWLRQSGRDGFVGADVADVMGIPRQLTEDVLEARQRGFRNEDVLRIAQISADDKRDFMLFMVQRPDDQVYFYFSTVRDGLKKAFVSIPSRNLVMPLDRLEAEARFRQEVRYWGERMESR
jgi:hypothetical protein